MKKLLSTLVVSALMSTAAFADTITLKGTQSDAPTAAMSIDIVGTIASSFDYQITNADMVAAGGNTDLAGTAVLNMGELNWVDGCSSGNLGTIANECDDTQLVADGIIKVKLPFSTAVEIGGSKSLDVTYSVDIKSLDAASAETNVFAAADDFRVSLLDASDGDSVMASKADVAGPSSASAVVYGYGVAGGGADHLAGSYKVQLDLPLKGAKSDDAFEAELSATFVMSNL